jgi:hypothetical protein
MLLLLFLLKSCVVRMRTWFVVVFVCFLLICFDLLILRISALLWRGAGLPDRLRTIARGNLCLLDVESLHFWAHIQVAMAFFIYLYLFQFG